jgi:hypothetical protein
MVGGGYRGILPDAQVIKSNNGGTEVVFRYKD